MVDEHEISSFEEKFDHICKRWNLAGFHAFGKEINNSTADNPLMVPFLTPWRGDVQPFQVLQAMRNVDSGIELKPIPNPLSR